VTTVGALRQAMLSFWEIPIEIIIGFSQELAERELIEIEEAGFQIAR
jgi:hypothetical protein